MIGIRSAISIRARGQRPHLEAVYMTAPRFICSNTKKALAERGPSIHDGEVKAPMIDTNSITRERIAATEAAIRPYIRRTPLVAADMSDFGLPPGALIFKLELL